MVFRPCTPALTYTKPTLGASIGQVAPAQMSTRRVAKQGQRE